MHGDALRGDRDPLEPLNEPCFLGLLLFRLQDWRHPIFVLISSAIRYSRVVKNLKRIEKAWFPVS
jgi:hypothetical protein